MQREYLYHNLSIIFCSIHNYFIIYTSILNIIFHHNTFKICVNIYYIYFEIFNVLYSFYILYVYCTKDFLQNIYFVEYKKRLLHRAIRINLWKPITISIHRYLYGCRLKWTLMKEFKIRNLKLQITNYN